MSQKNPVLKKLAALTLSASICTTIVGATPPEKQKSSSDILTYAGCAIAAVVVTGTSTYLAWAQLFVNKVLVAAEDLAKELNNDTPDTAKVKKLSMEFYKLLHEATGTDINSTISESKDFGQEDYENYNEPKTCKQAALALIEKQLSSSEDEENDSTKQKIKVNRLRYVDMQKLKDELKNTFNSEEGSVKKSEEEEKKKSTSSEQSTSKSSKSSEEESKKEEKSEEEENKSNEDE